MFTKFYIRALLLVSCVFVASNLTAGVSADTIVQTQDGPKPIRILKIGDAILCCDQNLNAVEGSVASIEEIETPIVVEITTADGVTFCVAPEQKLFITHKWVQANQVTLEDVLFKKDRTFVGITSIRYLQIPMTLRFITVDKNPNFWAAENGVLVHNGPLTGLVGYWVTKGICYGTIAAAAAAPVAAATVMTGGTAPAVAAATLGGAVSSAAGGSVMTGAVLAGVAATGETGALLAAAGTGMLAAETVASTTALYGAAAVTVGAIEGASMSVFSCLFACPFLP